jgi:hypothetical protein
MDEGKRWLKAEDAATYVRGAGRSVATPGAHPKATPAIA